jgi:beta-glucosidase-like glycosyl hydrolase
MVDLSGNHCSAYCILYVMIGIINRYNRVMQSYYEFIVARLNGEEIKTNYRYYRSLVKRGIAGFIIFGGELKTVRDGIKKLQSHAALPLIISSDLEQGLGQQIAGGTLFPPAMAVAAAMLKYAKTRGNPSDLKMLKDIFRATAEEARYAGINTIYAPVLDINTNPENPIISVRAFGEDARTVSSFGSRIIRTFRKYGISACGKHFPGHGDTETDSHIRLPTIRRTMRGLLRRELIPFRKAIADGVDMIMLGHLNVPAIDSLGIPASLSSKTVALLRGKMGFKGIIITDAMNMGGVGKFSEASAVLRALSAGVNVILHPSDPEEVVTYLDTKKPDFESTVLRAFRRRLPCRPAESAPDLAQHLHLSRTVTEKAVSLSRDFRIQDKSCMIILNDEDRDTKGRALKKLITEKIPGMRVLLWDKKTRAGKIPACSEAFLIVAVFSSVKGWKGGASIWLKRTISSLEKKTDVFVSFGSPYILPKSGKAAKMIVYWDSGLARDAAVRLLISKIQQR